MNIEDARKSYKELLSIFTKEELEGKDTPEDKQVVTQEEFNKFFEEEILSKIDKSKTSFPDKNSFSHIRLSNSNGYWLFDYDTDPKKLHFWYQYDRVYLILIKKFSLEDYELQRFIKILVESNFNLHECQPYYHKAFPYPQV